MCDHGSDDGREETRTDIYGFLPPEQLKTPDALPECPDSVPSTRAYVQASHVRADTSTQKVKKSFLKVERELSVHQ